MCREMRSCPNSSSLDVKLNVFSEMNLAIKHRNVDASSCSQCQISKLNGLDGCSMVPTKLSFLGELLEGSFYWEDFDARLHVIEVIFILGIVFLIFLSRSLRGTF